MEIGTGVLEINHNFAALALAGMTMSFVDFLVSEILGFTE